MALSVAKPNALATLTGTQNAQPGNLGNTTQSNAQNGYDFQTGGTGGIIGSFVPKQAAQESPPQVLGSSTTNAQTNAELQQAAQDRFQVEQGLTSANDALGRVDNQQNTAINNIGNDYTSAYNTLTGQGQTATRDFNTGRDQQLQGYQTARDSNDSNARNLLLGTRRLLGSQGAGGGSADLYGAPLAATTEANNQNTVDKQTNEQNIGALTTSYNDNQDKIKNGFNDLAKQRDNSVNSTKSQFEQQRADILQNIATLTGQKAILNGGDYKAAAGAAQPYIDRISGILNTIDGLAARPTGIQTPNVTLSAPNLAQYDLGRFNAPAVAQQDPTLYQSPNTAALLGYNQDKKQQLA